VGATPPTEEQIRRLRWQCRRGMLELDDLLLGFLDRGFRDLDAAGRAGFLALLGEQDQDLSDWFMSRRVPQDPKTAALVAQIIAVARAAVTKGD